MNIYFVYRKSQENLGSVKMRVFQMKKLLETRFPMIETIGIFSIKITLLQTLRFRNLKNNSILIFNKDAIDRVDHKTIKTLRKRGVKFGLDALDKDMNYFDYRKTDFLVASSLRQYRYLKSVVTTIKPEPIVTYVPHQADIRLRE